MAQESSAGLERLDALIGRWKTEGWTREAPGVPAHWIDAVDTYERLPGGALLHLFDAQVGDQKVEGAEIIGYDPARGGYVTQYFGSEGANAYEANLVDDDGPLVWTHAQREGPIQRHLQRRAQHDQRSLGRARRRLDLATVDGHHLDEGSALIGAVGRYA